MNFIQPKLIILLNGEESLNNQQGKVMSYKRLKCCNKEKEKMDKETGEIHFMNKSQKKD